MNFIIPWDFIITYLGGGAFPPELKFLVPPGRKLYFFITLSLHAPRDIPPQYSDRIRLLGSPLSPNLPFRGPSAAPFGILGPPQQPHLAAAGLS